MVASRRKAASGARASKGRRAEYERAKAELRRLGFVIPGSLTVRRQTCGEPSCACHKDPARRHGPYYQVSWKERGKTVSRVVPASLVPSYRQWIGNDRALRRVVARMRGVSRKAADASLARHSAKARKVRTSRK